MHSPSTQFDKKEDVEGMQANGFHGEEIAGEHLASIVAEKRAPGAALPLALRRWRNMTAFEDVSHTGSAEFKSQFLEFNLYLTVTPSWVLGSQPYN